jgi:hypothetical protein
VKWWHWVLIVLGVLLVLYVVLGVSLTRCIGCDGPYIEHNFTKNLNSSVERSEINDVSDRNERGLVIVKYGLVNRLNKTKNFELNFKRTQVADVELIDIELIINREVTLQPNEIYVNDITTDSPYSGWKLTITTDEGIYDSKTFTIRK